MLGHITVSLDMAGTGSASLKLKVLTLHDSVMSSFCKDAGFERQLQNICRTHTHRGKSKSIGKTLETKPSETGTADT